MAIPYLVELIGASVELKRHGRLYVGLCPFHAEKTPSLQVFSGRHKWRWHCHGCGADGDAIDWLMRTRSLTYKQAAATLGLPVAPDPVVQASRKERARRAAALNHYRDTHVHCTLPDWAIDV